MRPGHVGSRNTPAGLPVDTPAGLHLVDTGWEARFDAAMATAPDRLRIICPFIKRGVIARLLRRHVPATIEVLTRYDLQAFADGVSDAEALAVLLEHGARVRGVRSLHAKVYLFGASRAIVTSANLTRAALLSNHEFGFVAEDSAVAARCADYFDTLWPQAGPDLTPERVLRWREQVDAYKRRGAPPFETGLGDEGVDVGIEVEDEAAPADDAIPVRAFVKFFGRAADRVLRTHRVWDEVERAECHWACTYPKGKRPRQPEDGSIMFMARMVKRPDDIVIFGRAVAWRHRGPVDDASAADIARQGWKAKWSHYVRVHHAEFIAGDLQGGVSLNAMMAALQATAFATTERNAARSKGNTNPRRAYNSRPDVELSRQGYAWISTRLAAAFAACGKLQPADLNTLYWPD